MKFRCFSKRVRKLLEWFLEARRVILDVRDAPGWLLGDNYSDLTFDIFRENSRKNDGNSRENHEIWGKLGNRGTIRESQETQRFSENHMEIAETHAIRGKFMQTRKTPENRGKNMNFAERSRNRGKPWNRGTHSCHYGKYMYRYNEYVPRNEKGFPSHPRSNEGWQFTAHTKFNFQHDSESLSALKSNMGDREIWKIELTRCL